MMHIPHFSYISNDYLFFIKTPVCEAMVKVLGNDIIEKCKTSVQLIAINMCMLHMNMNELQ